MEVFGGCLWAPRGLMEGLYYIIYMGKSSSTLHSISEIMQVENGVTCNTIDSPNDRQSPGAFFGTISKGKFQLLDDGRIMPCSRM